MTNENKAVQWIMLATLLIIATSTLALVVVVAQRGA